GEEANDPTLAATFAALGDLYVNDAFGSAHRAHASTEAVAHLLKPAVAGFLMERELRYLGDALDQPRRPFLAVLGGAKISGKIDVIEALLPRVAAAIRRPPSPAWRTRSPTSRRAAARRSSSSKASRFPASRRSRTREPPPPVRRQLEDAHRARRGARLLQDVPDALPPP